MTKQDRFNAAPDAPSTAADAQTTIHNLNVRRYCIDSVTRVQLAEDVDTLARLVVRLAGAIGNGEVSA